MSTQHRVRRIALFVLAVLVLAAWPVLAAPAKTEGKAEGRKVVNLNTADASQLALLPRIGPSVAQRILTFRKEHGAFKSADDLLLVRGIGEKTYALIKPYVAVSGETTLKEKVRTPRTKAGTKTAAGDR
jgi:competence protein ComEA